MPDSNSDPENYSIDEMLDRLKNRGDGEGELVTRADGTNALKVRKRKRRTDQTRDNLKAQNQRMQLIQIAGFIIFMVVLAILCGMMILYSNSAPFRDGLIARIENTAGAETKLQQFRMNPATASAAKIEMIWSESHVMHRLQANSLKAKISPISFVGKVFQGQEVVAAKGNLFLTSPNSGDSSVIEAPEASRVKFSRYSVTSLNVFFSKDQSWGRMLEDVEASYLPIKTSKGGEIRLVHGLLKMKGWPPLALDRSYIQVRERELDVKSMRFQIPVLDNQKNQDRGSIDLTGIIRPMDEGASHQLQVNVDSFQISHLLGNAGMGRFFHGRTITNPDEGSNSLQFTPGSGEEAVLRLNVTHSLDSRIALAQFKFLGHLAITLEDRWYELPSFDDEVKLLIEKSGHRVELEEINLEQHARMAIRGSISVKDEAGAISGSLKVGIPEIIIDAAKDRRLDVLFSSVREGYRWIDIELGGTSAAPLDNFKDLYQAVRLTNAPEVKAAPKPEGVDSFESLIIPE